MNKEQLLICNGHNKKVQMMRNSNPSGKIPKGKYIHKYKERCPISNEIINLNPDTNLKDCLTYIHYPCSRKGCKCQVKLTKTHLKIVELIKSTFDNTLPITAEKTYFNDGVQSVLDKLQLE